MSRHRDLEQVKKQLLILQRKKKEEEYVFKTEGAKKQASFVTKMTDWIKDDLRSVLESEYGPLPDRVSSMISSGESVALERLHLLKIADTYVLRVGRGDRVHGRGVG